MEFNFFDVMVIGFLFGFCSVSVGWILGWIFSQVLSFVRRIR